MTRSSTEPPNGWPRRKPLPPELDIEGVLRPRPRDSSRTRAVAVVRTSWTVSPRASSHGVRWQPSPRAFSIAQRRCGNCRAHFSSWRYPDALAGTRRVASCWWDRVARAVAVWDCLWGSTPSMTRDMDVSFLLTGRGAVADSPTFGRHAHASVQSGHDRAPAGGMPTVSQPYGGRMSPSHPVDALGTLLTEQHAQHSQQVGCLDAGRLSGRVVFPPGEGIGRTRPGAGSRPRRGRFRPPDPPCRAISSCNSGRPSGTVY